MRRGPDRRSSNQRTRGLCALFSAVAAVSALQCPAWAGPAIGQFELKTLESEPGYLEFQSQNAWSFGQPSRTAAAVGGETLYDDNSVMRQRHALEMELGFTTFLKMRIGIEYEKERLDEPVSIASGDAFGALKLEEVGGELIAVFIERDGDGFGLGAVAEVERPLNRDDQMGLILGPIFEFAAGPWFFAAIPMAVHHFNGEPEDGVRDDKWDAAYAFQAAYTFSPSWTLALEAYGTFDRIGSTGERGEASLRFGDHNQHRLGPILYYTIDLGRSLRSDRPAADGEDVETSKVEIGVGYLAGLNENTPDSTLKLSVEVEF